MTTTTLEGCRVVVCRSAEQSTTLTHRLEAAGAVVQHLGLLPVVAPSDGGVSLRAALARPEEVDWVVLTSANGAAAVIDAATDQWPLSIAFAAVGQATATVLQRAGVPSVFVASRSTAACLAAELPLDRGTRVLAPLAALAGDDLTSGLRDRGFRVTRVEAYGLGLAPDLDAATLRRVAEADAVLFTSPSSVDRFAAQCSDPWPPTVVSIGPSTSAQLSMHDRMPTAEAGRPGLDGLIAALVNTLGP